MPVSFQNTEIAFRYKSNAELKRAAWLFTLMNYNWLVQAGTRLTPLAFKMKLPVTTLVRNTIYRQFCGGENAEQSIHTARLLAGFQVSTILDYGVEGKETDEQFEKNAEEMLHAISLASASGTIPFVSMKITGYAPVSLLEDMSNGKNLHESQAIALVKMKKRIHRVCQAALQAGVAVMIDAEESWIQPAIDSIADEAMQLYNKEKVTVMNTYQLYRHDRLDFLKQSFNKAQTGNYLLGAKIVRGAYLEKERKRSRKLNYPDPIQPDKVSTDRDYNSAITFCLNHVEQISLCIASHNEQSNQYAAELALSKNISPQHKHLLFSQLLGMSDHISFNLAREGFRVSKYVPYGPVSEVIPYLMRRAQENTSVKGQTGRELSLLREECKRRGL